MNEERLDPQMVTSSIPLLLGFGVDPEQPLADKVSNPTAAANDSTTPLSVGTPNGPCSACSCTPAWLQLRGQAHFWRSCFKACKRREDRLRQQLAKQKAWQRLYEQAQERVRVLEQRVVALEAEQR